MRGWVAAGLALSCSSMPVAPVLPAPAAEARASTGGTHPSVAALPAPAETASAAHADDPEAVDDEIEGDGLPEPAATIVRDHPLDGIEPDQIAERLKSDPQSLGSMSIGAPSGGALFGGVQMPQGEHWVLVDPHNAWGTRETVDYLEAAIEAVYTRFGPTHPLYIGHISARRGGPLSPHISHQAGRDVDISYFYSDANAARWYVRAHANNLDRARTWAFVRALVTHTDVELILIDHSIQRLLEQHALAIGEDPEWVATLFRGKAGQLRPLILHAKGHATHLHIRFYNPIAQETARRCHEALTAQGLVKPLTQFVTHRAKKGETLGMLARKYDTNVKAIQRANGLRSTLIVAGHSYRIPKRTGIAAPRPVKVPERRLPPPAAAR